MTIEELQEIKAVAQRIHAAAVAAGKWKNKPEWEAKLMDIVCDIANAAANEKGNNHALLSQFDYWEKEGEDFSYNFNDCILGTVEDCLADAVIDILDTVEGFYPEWMEDICLCKFFTREKVGNGFGDCFSIFCARMIRAILTNGKSPWIITNLIPAIVYCSAHGIDLRRHVQLKMKYNELGRAVL